MAGSRIASSDALRLIEAETADLHAPEMRPGIGGRFFYCISVAAFTTQRIATMISSDASYPIKEFCDLLGIKHSALKKMRLDGLTVRYVGNRGYIRGADFNDWLSTQGTDAPGPPAGTRPAHLKVTG